MKILVVNLLRLGDLVMITPVLQGLRQKYPKLELHLLINSSSRALVPLLDGVDHVHYFQRDTLQKSLGHPESPLLEPWDLMDKQIKELNQHGFDQVINLTQNRLSGWLCSLIQTKEYKGLVYNRQGQACFSGSWFQFLNNRSYKGEGDSFHYCDIFQYGAELPGSYSRISLCETEKGRQEALDIVGAEKNYIVIQPFTSDFKKDWPIDKWADCLGQFQQSHPKERIFVLGADFELSRLQELETLCRERGVRLRLALCSLEGAFSILQKAKLLVTGDTSIKHMACATQCKIIEICLGSSEYRKTGCYSDRALIVLSKEICVPCDHKGVCYRNRQECAESVSPDLVSFCMSDWLVNQGRQLEAVASEYSDAVDILETHFMPTGYWYATSLNKETHPWHLNRWLEQSTWKLLLQKEHLRPIGQYGTEGVRLHEFIGRIFKPSDQRKLKDQLDFMESDQEELEKSLTCFLESFRRSLKRFSESQTWGNFEEELKEYQDHSEKGSVIISHLSQMGNSFEGVRKAQLYLNESYQRTQIKLRLIRCIKSQLMEQK